MAAVTVREHYPTGANVMVHTSQVDSDLLIDASTTQTVDVVTLPADAEVLAVWIDNEVAATDAGSITALTCQIGTASDPNAFTTAFDLFGSTGRHHIKGAWVSGDGLAVKALFTATGANLGDAAVTGLDTGLTSITIVYIIVR
jgi:hypothetical protein